MNRCIVSVSVREPLLSLLISGLCGRTSHHPRIDQVEERSFMNRRRLEMGSLTFQSLVLHVIFPGLSSADVPVIPSDKCVLCR